MNCKEYFQALKTNSKTIVAYVLVIILILILTFSFQIFSMTYCLLISGLTLVVIILYPFIRGFSFQIFTFLLTIFSGYYGFLTKDYRHDYTPINAFYSTIRLFLMDTDQVFSKDGSIYIAYPMSIEIARWSAVVYVISTILQLFMNYFGHTLRTSMYKMFGHHTVLFGMNPKSLALAKDLLKNKRKVLIIQEKEDNNSQELKEKGAVMIKGSLLEEKTFRKAGIERAKNLIVFHDQDAYNLNIIQVVYQYLKKQGKRKKAIPFYIQQNHTITQTLFDSIEKAVSDINGTNIELHPVSLQSLIARQLLDKHPLYKGYEQRAKDPNGEPFHLLFIGFGLTGQQIATQAIQRAHFTNKHLLHITVVDQEAKKIERQWHESIPRLQDTVHINFINQDIEVHDIGSFVKQQSTKVTHVYICLDQDEQDALQGIRLYQQIKDIPIFIKLQGNHHFANWLHGDKAFPHLYRFGAWEEVLTEEMVINEKLDQMAKTVHKFYLSSNPKGDPWEKLTFFLKNSNRTQVDHLETKLFLMGLSLSESSVPSVIEEQPFLDEIHSILDDLAIIEHRRWNAFHFMNGWDTLPIEQTSKDHDRDKVKKLHACLVPWEVLPQVGARTNRNYKEDDRETIRNMYQLVKESKKFIRKS